MTDILKSFSNLQCELDVARSKLKGVNENIKRLIGRDPSDNSIKPILKKKTVFLDEERGRFLKNQNERKLKRTRLQMPIHENEEPFHKKRTVGLSVFERISERPFEGPIKQHKGMISKVIVTPKEVPSRQERMEAQSKDSTSVARNKRMFGALLGTLQKFQQEETKQRIKEDKRAKLEKKIEEHEIKEKEEMKREKQELFLNRRKKQAEIKMIELKMFRMREYVLWEDSQKHRMHFICTNTTPPVYFLPRKLTDTNKKELENSREKIQNLIDSKRARIQEELLRIEEKGKRMFESKGGHKSLEMDNGEQDSVEDEDISMAYSDKFCSSEVDNIENPELEVDKSVIHGQSKIEKIENTTKQGIPQSLQVNCINGSVPLENQDKVTTTELDNMENNLKTIDENHICRENISEHGVENHSRTLEENN